VVNKKTDKKYNQCSVCKYYTDHQPPTVACHCRYLPLAYYKDERQPLYSGKVTIIYVKFVRRWIYQT